MFAFANRRLLCCLFLDLGFLWSLADRETTATIMTHEHLFFFSPGAAPLVVAKGGFSGVFPDSSQGAYSFAMITSAPDTAMWCDVQLTKDGVGVCLRDINMKNCTSVDQAYPERKRTYVIDGVRKTGWFVSDFTIAELQSVSREYNNTTASLPLKRLGHCISSQLSSVVSTN